VKLGLSRARLRVRVRVAFALGLGTCKISYPDLGDCAEVIRNEQSERREVIAREEGSCVQQERVGDTIVLTLRQMLRSQCQTKGNTKEKGIGKGKKGEGGGT